MAIFRVEPGSTVYFEGEKAPLIFLKLCDTSDICLVKPLASQ